MAISLSVVLLLFAASGATASTEWHTLSQSRAEVLAFWEDRYHLAQPTELRIADEAQIAAIQEETTDEQPQVMLVPQRPSVPLTN